MPRVSPSWRVVLTWIALTLLSGPSTARLFGCDVPVFRYAMEHWYAAPYELVLLTNGPLSANDAAVVKFVEAALTAGPAHPNLKVRTVDLLNPSGVAEEHIWARAGRPELPYLVLLYPREQRLGHVAWSGALTMANARRLSDSPARREIAQRIVDGHSAVWVMIECGDTEKDAEAASLLRRVLAHEEERLKRPSITGVTLNQQNEIGGARVPNLEVKFSVISLSRSDRDENVLIEMLLHTESDLVQYSLVPIAFPIYGRGRVLYALVGKGINEQNVREACRFLTGPCACVTKDAKPGTDLMMSVDWQKGIAGSRGQGVEITPLVGLSTLAEAARRAHSDASKDISRAEVGRPVAETEVPMAKIGEPVPKRRAQTQDEPAPVPEIAATPSSRTEPAAPGHSGALLRNLIAGVALIVVVILILVLRILKQHAGEHP